MSSINENYERRTIVWPDDYDIIKQELCDAFVNEAVKDEFVDKVIDEVANCDDEVLLGSYVVFGALIFKLIGESNQEKIRKALI